MISTLLCAAIIAVSPPDSGERLVLQTSAGGIVVALAPNDAPKTVQQIKRLVWAGLYDGVSFFRAEPGYLVQTARAEDRERGLSPEERALFQRIPLETSALKHVRGALSMARPNEDQNGGTSSFSILAGNAAHLDGAYTVFGHVEEGFDVLDELASVPTDSEGRPRIAMSIVHAEMVDSPAAARDRRWQRQSLFSQVIAVSEKGIRHEVAALIAAMLFCTGALAALGRASTPRIARAVRMTVVLISGFGLIVVLLPIGHRVPLAGTALFAAVVVWLKWMNRFELPPAAKAGNAEQAKALLRSSPPG